MKYQEQGNDPYYRFKHINQSAGYSHEYAFMKRKLCIFSRQKEYEMENDAIKCEGDKKGDEMAPVLTGYKRERMCNKKIGYSCKWNRNNEYDERKEVFYGSTAKSIYKADHQYQA